MAKGDVDSQGMQSQEEISYVAFTLDLPVDTDFTLLFHCSSSPTLQTGHMHSSDLLRLLRPQ